MKEDQFTAIGIDVGGTKIAAALVSFPAGVVREKRTIPTATASGAASILGEVRSLAQSIAVRAHETNLHVGGIGLGLCEIVTRDGTIASGASVKWSEREVQDALRDIGQVVIEADVRAAARAEALFGAGRGLHCFLYVSVGTGISCCLVIDGEPFLGARGATGTMASGPMPTFDGHMPNRSLEEVASGPALVARFNEDASKRVERAQEVLAAAESGDSRALSVVESGAAALGGSIGWLVNVLNPEAIILGGGLGLSEGRFRKTLIDSARRHIWWPGHRDLPIRPAQTGREAGVIGAAVSACLQFAPQILKASHPN
jgi:glucokinase